MKDVIVSVNYVGYQGHFLCSCSYHLTTIIANKKRMVMVSTVGRLIDTITKKPTTIGCRRMFETEVFKAKYSSETGFIEADVSKSLDGEYYNITEEQELNILKDIITNKEVNNLANECEKLADKGHKKLVDKWVEILKKEVIECQN